MTPTHRDTIIAQFSRQAIPFARVPGHLDAIDHLREAGGLRADDRVLDVACGPGLVACAFAPHCARVTGIDITPAMIDQARQRQAGLGLANLDWHIGDVQPLPFADGSFTLVITRYSLHHFPDPRAVLAEMVRVCAPGGRVLVADVMVPPEKAAAYDRLERLRDPSHVHALTTAEFRDLFLGTGLVGCRQSGYGVEIGLEAQLAASFPAPGDEERLREMVTADIGTDALGIDARRRGDEVVYTVPIGVFVGRRG